MNKETIRRAVAGTYPIPELSEPEILIRAREAYISQRRFLPRWMKARIRAGRWDNRLSTTINALQDVARPLHFIVADRDHATCALIMHVTPGLSSIPPEYRDAVAAGLMTAVRFGRRG